MSEFILAEGTEDDLAGIATYTVSKWGPEQARRYAASLDRHFQTLANGAIRTKGVLDHWPELRVSRCQHHYIFSIDREDSPTVMLAVLHENMDMPARLRERMRDEGLNDE